MKILSWRNDLKLNATLCFTMAHANVRFTKETFVTWGSRVKHVLPWAMTKWTKHIVSFNEEEDEDTLVEEGPQIERGTVLHRDANVRVTQETFVTSDSPVKRDLTWAMSKWIKTL